MSTNYDDQAVHAWQLKRDNASISHFLKLPRANQKCRTVLRDIERVHGQSNQATVARERDCLDQLLADVEHLSAMEYRRASIRLSWPNWVAGDNYANPYLGSRSAA
jgi:hypothetical protein